MSQYFSFIRPAAVILAVICALLLFQPMLLHGVLTTFEPGPITVTNQKTQKPVAGAAYHMFNKNGELIDKGTIKRDGEIGGSASFSSGSSVPACQQLNGSYYVWVGGNSKITCNGNTVVIYSAVAMRESYNPQTGRVSVSGGSGNNAEPSTGTLIMNKKHIAM